MPIKTQVPHFGKAKYFRRNGRDHISPDGEGELVVAVDLDLVELTYGHPGVNYTIATDWHVSDIFELVCEQEYTAVDPSEQSILDAWVATFDADTPAEMEDKVRAKIASERAKPDIDGLPRRELLPSKSTARSLRPS